MRLSFLPAGLGLHALLRDSTAAARPAPALGMQSHHPCVASAAMGAPDTDGSPQEAPRLDEAWQDAGGMLMVSASCPCILTSSADGNLPTKLVSEPVRPSRFTGGGFLGIYCLGKCLQA